MAADTEAGASNRFYSAQVSLLATLRALILAERPSHRGRGCCVRRAEARQEGRRRGGSGRQMLRRT